MEPIIPYYNNDMSRFNLVKNPINPNTETKVYLDFQKISMKLYAKTDISEVINSISKVCNIKSSETLDNVRSFLYENYYANF